MEWTNIRRVGMPNSEEKDEDHLVALAAKARIDERA